MEVDEEYQYDPFPFIGSKKNQKGNSSSSITQSLLKFLCIGLFLSYCANFILDAVDKEKKIKQDSSQKESLNSRVTKAKVREANKNRAVVDMVIDGDAQTFTITGEYCRGLKAGNVPDSSLVNILVARYDKEKEEVSSKYDFFAHNYASSRYDLMAEAENESQAFGLHM